MTLLPPPRRVTKVWNLGVIGALLIAVLVFATISVPRAVANGDKGKRWERVPPSTEGSLREDSKSCRSGSGVFVCRYHYRVQLDGLDEGVPADLNPRYDYGVIWFQVFAEDRGTSCYRDLQFDLDIPERLDLLEVSPDLALRPNQKPYRTQLQSDTEGWTVPPISLTSAPWKVYPRGLKKPFIERDEALQRIRWRWEGRAKEFRFAFGFAVGWLVSDALVSDVLGSDNMDVAVLRPITGTAGPC